MVRHFHIIGGSGGFAPERHPIHLRLVAALGRVHTRGLDEGFVYADADCGDGVALAALAAALPQGQFIGIYQHADAVSAGKALAKAAGLGNLSFRRAQTKKFDLPACDVIVLGDLFADTDPASRKALIDAAGRCLLAQGLLCVTYRVTAGWSAALPLLDALRGYTEAMSADPTLKAEAATTYARFLRQAEVPWLRDHPVLNDFIAELEAADPAAVARRLYEAPPWPASFADVAADMAQDGLFYAGSAELYLNFADLAVPAVAQAALDSLGSREDFETQGDILRGQTVRHDIFVKGAPSQGDEARLATLAAIPFAALVGAADVAREAEFGPFRMGYEAPIFGQLIEAAAHGAPTAQNLWTRSDFAATPRDHVLDGLCFLAANGQIVPLSAPPPSAPSGAEVIAFSPFNRAVLETRLFVAPSLPLIGAGGVVIELSHGEAAILAALADEPAGEAADRLLEILQAAGQEVTVGGTAIDNPALQRSLLESRIDVFRKTRLPSLLRLGIVTAA